jgi:hypothetical protein
MAKKVSNKVKKARKKRIPPPPELVEFAKQFAKVFINIHVDKKDNFITYCREAFGISQEEYEKELNEAGLDDDNIKQVLLELKERLKGEGKLTKALGNFGEAICSWHLFHDRNYWVFRYSWSKHPFDTKTSIDVCAIDLKRNIIAFLEVKAGQSKASATSQVKELFKQVFDNEKANIFRLGANAHNQILKRLSFLISQNIVPNGVTASTLNLISPDNFARIGFIVTPESIKYGTLGLDPNNESDDHSSSTHELNIALVDQFESWWNEWLKEARLAEHAGKFS